MNLKKFSLSTNGLVFLGSVVSAKDIQVDEEICERPTPRPVALLKEKLTSMLV